jgi:ELWxxDGT repeat protein
LRDRLFLAVYNESKGAELWTSRGDTGSTRLVVDLRPGEPGSYPQALANIGGVLVFAADDGMMGLEAWRSDGTAAGTVRLGDINPGRDASSPGPFTQAGDDVFTGAFDAVHGRELYAIPLQDVLLP